MQLPSGYTIFGQSNNGQTLTAIRDGHTAGKPLLFIIDRTEAKYNAQLQKYSVPAYRVRVIRGTVNSDGAPQGERLLADLTIRVPVGSSDELGVLLGDLNAFIGQTDFGTDAVVKQLFPSEPAA